MQGSMREIITKADVSNIQAITALVNEELESRDCPIKTNMLIDIAVDEICSNIAFYAYPDDIGDIRVSIDFVEAPRGAVLIFEDEGIPFNPLEKEEPDVSLDIDERGIGGLGIFMVKKSMDDVTYRREGNKNILTIEKQF